MSQPAPAHRGIVRQSTHSKPWPDAYSELANPLLVTATFAGTITFSLVLAPRDGGGRDVEFAAKLLAYASSLFLGSAIGCISISVLCRAGQHEGGWGAAVPRVVAQVTFVMVGILMIAAFGLLLGSLSVLGFGGPFALGVVLFSCFTAVPVVVGCVMLSPYLRSRRTVL
ncbi:MAG: hypothetical protein M1840_005182 [Geoglossum simile]|nr:MAG: hypothetical protein M1840_005182 [Geoglossum simile]